MTDGDLRTAVQALDERFLLDHPWEAAQRVEELDPEVIAAELAEQRVHTLLPLFRRLAPPAAARVLEQLPETLAAGIIGELLPTEALPVLGALDPDATERILPQLPPAIRQELEELANYPADSAGRLMDTRTDVFRDSMTVRHALDALRRHRTRTARSLFLVDADNRLVGKAAIQDVAVADPDDRLAHVAQPITASVHALTPQDEVVDLVEAHRLADLPVVDIDGRMLGVIYHAMLVQAMQEDFSANVQMMSGASPEERALSPPMFAVRKRLPWLQINLLTAFLAAAVVGLFESTIAKYTALAVLLPVVAGQSGNSGAQALAVTMRGLVLREITPRQWFTVAMKEASVGLINGIEVAITCGLGVYFWSRSIGLVIVIMSSMVLAMLAAGLAGAIVPIVLRRLGQDPAQSSSIILTTVTDVAGFFSFLGIATLLSGLLAAG
ncbi:MAG TPA: magnesium transporter [Steroidobacteraceae bacterium]|nr:magnesium transporter [Steroidobacteraceae bacterium]